MTRGEAIKHLSEWMDEKMWMCFGTIDREAIGMAIEALSAKTDWIPCSERLPSEERYYLCCNKGYLPFIARYYGGQWHDFYGIISHVDAWQPLPKPYRKGDET